MVFVFALAAAACYAVASVLQQQSAASVANEHSLRLGLLVRLTRQPLWLAGIVVDLAGFGFEAAALAVGSLALVQPLLVLGLPVALVGAARLHRQGLGRNEWYAVAAVTAGVALFVAAALPSAGASFAAIHRWILTGVLVSASVAFLLIGLKAAPRWKATLLASATGMVHAFSAALTKSSAALVQHHPLGALGHWEPYALVVVGVGSMLLAQSAFQSGNLASSLPALTLVPPAVSLPLGIYLFGETVTATPTGITFAISGAAVAAAGVYYLGATTDRLTKNDRQPADGARSAVTVPGHSD